MKRLFSLLFIFSLFFVINVNAVSKDDGVQSYGPNSNLCTAHQDDDMHISGDIYFRRCMQAKKSGYQWNFSYYSTNSVSCSNGNISPYVNLYKDGCDNLSGNSTIQYCTRIYYFDCDRTSNGSQFTTTTTTKKTTTKPTTKRTTTKTTTKTTTTSAVKKDNNTYLSSLSLSSGTIIFNKDVKEYKIEVESTITSITVTATPESDKSKVSVTGGTSLVDGDNKITVTVTAEDGSVGTYIINVYKLKEVSNNAKLESLTIAGYEIDFNPDKNDYTISTKESRLEIDARTEDENAIYMISGNNNLKNGSVISLLVTAEDGLTNNEYTITIDTPSSGLGIIIIFIVIIVVVIGVGIYYFYIKKKNGGDKEYEYE